MIGHTAAFVDLTTSFHKLVDNWQPTAFAAFCSSLFGYLFGIGNGEMLLILLILGLLDTVLGSAFAIKHKEFSAAGMAKLMYKTILYGSTLILFHMAQIMTSPYAPEYSHFIDVFAYAFLILREAKSINEKLASADINIPFNPFQVIEAKLNEFSNRKP